MIKEKRLQRKCDGHLFFAAILTLSILSGSGCGKKSSESSDQGQTYSFTSPMNGRIQIVTNQMMSSSSSTIAQKTSAKSRSETSSRGSSKEARSTSGPTLCSSVICFTPTAISGKYYGTGLLIQSGGNGMMAYFGQENWSSIVGTSPSYDFDMATPVTNTGTLTCCTSSGNLASGNSYIESVAYLFSYIDVTFAVSGITGNTSMNGTYTLRFVMADGAISGGVRGDILVSDAGTFKWMNSDDSSLSVSRPANPVVMNTAVKEWTNPFGEGHGNQQIPVIYANVLPSSGSGLMTITETELRATNKTYSFGFNPTNFIVFPTVLQNDINMIYSLKELLSKVHLGGLPHSGQPMGIGNPADTELVISN